jgi:hypothetical protein
MTEWMRLGFAAGALVVALACAVIAARVDETRLRFSPWGQSAFFAAAVLLLACIPVLALIAADALGRLEALGLIPPLAGAAVLVVAGRRSAIRIGRDWASAAAAWLAPGIARPSGTDVALVGRLTNRATPARVPVCLVSVVGERHLVELNQN